MIVVLPASRLVFSLEFLFNFSRYCLQFMIHDISFAIHIFSQYYLNFDEHLVSYFFPHISIWWSCTLHEPSSNRLLVFMIIFFFFLVLSIFMQTFLICITFIVCGAFNKFPDFFCTGIYNCCRRLRIQYVIAIHLMRWLTNSYHFRFKWTATAAIWIHPTKAWLSQLVNFKNAIWMWGHFRRMICNKIEYNWLNSIQLSITNWPNVNLSHIKIRLFSF